MGNHQRDVCCLAVCRRFGSAREQRHYASINDLLSVQIIVLGGYDLLTKVALLAEGCGNGKLDVVAV